MKFKSKLIAIFRFLIILLGLFSYNVSAFNLAPVPSARINEPKISSYIQKVHTSYFGFSIVLRENSILIGAPRAQSPNDARREINETGIVYKCQWPSANFEESNCKEFIVEVRPNLKDGFYSEIRDHQWLGGSMDGSTKDTDPVLICAPRFKGFYDHNKSYYEQEQDSLHGICYWSRDTLGDRITETTGWKLKHLTNPRAQIKNLVYYFQLGQQGFSAHITPDNEQFLMGAPGIHNWRGSVIRYFVRDNSADFLPKMSNGLYMGYAVGSGYLDNLNPNRIIYVLSAPRINGESGAVYIYNSMQGNYFELRGEQYGEYFGYALLVVDVNGDSLDDVLVTAPFYRVDQQVDVGAIHMFINEGSFRFRREIIAAPFQTEARMGMTISKLGDINLDGYQDIAVGAPFFEKHGAVLIYLGSDKGLRKTPSQIIRFTDSIDERLPHGAMFGHGLSKGADVDRNGFNDLAIGAPNAERVYLYRAYPVVRLIIDLNVQPKRLDLEANQLYIRICHRFESNSTSIGSLPIRLNLTLDQTFKRLKFQGKNSLGLDTLKYTSPEIHCERYQVSVEYRPNHLFKPMEIRLNYGLHKDGSQQMRSGFCDDCSVLDPDFDTAIQTSVKYIHGCKNDVCNVDLKLSEIQKPEKITFDQNKNFTMQYYLENSGEGAFEAELKIKIPISVALVRVPPNCETSDNVTHTIMTCSMAQSGQSFIGSTSIDISMDASGFHDDEQEFLIEASVSSIGVELHPEDNRIVSRLQVERSATVEIHGYPNNTYIELKNSRETEIVSYEFRVNNFGPNSLWDLHLQLYIPFAYNSMELINTTALQLTVTTESQIFIETSFDEINGSESKNPNELMQQESIQYSLPIPENLTIIANCTKDLNTNCRTKTLHFPVFRVGEEMTLRLEMTFDANSLRKLLKDDKEYLMLSSDISLVPDNVYRKLTVTKKFIPITFRYIKAPQTPLWIYIAAAILGLLILTVLTLVLLKLGFFRRTVKEEMAQLVKQEEEFKRKSGIPHSNEAAIDICADELN